MKLFVAFVLMLEAVVLTFYAQMPTSLNFFAINNVHHEILGFSVGPMTSRRLTRSGWYSPAQYWQAFTRIWVTKAKTYDADEIYSRHVYVLTGLFDGGSCGSASADAQGLTSPWFIVLVYLFQAWVNCLLAPWVWQ
ncbi:hypothetical protein ACLB1T_09800 [Escherichia coli]